MSISATVPAMPRKRIPEHERRVLIGGKVPPDLLRRMQAVAVRERRTVSQLVEFACLEFLAVAEKKPVKR